jgi:hypothetical protein
MCIFLLLIMGCSESEKQGVELINEEKLIVHVMDIGTVTLEEEAARIIIEALQHDEILHHPDLWASGRFYKEILIEYDDREYPDIHEERLDPSDVSEAMIDSTHFYSISFSISPEKMNYYKKYLETGDLHYLREHVNIYDPKQLSYRIYGDRKHFGGLQQ